MSFFKSLGKIGSGILNVIGIKTGSYARPDGSNFPVLNSTGIGGNIDLFYGSKPKNPTGFDSGKGTLDNPLSTGEVVISPKKNTSGLKNWIDTAINGIGAIGGAIGAIKGNNGSTSTDGASKDTADKLNDWLGRATADSRQMGLDSSTKTFLGVLGGGILAYFIFKKR